MASENDASKESVLEEELKQTKSQLHDLEEDNAHLKDKVSELEQEVAHNVELANRSWDEKLADGFFALGQRWSDYGPIIIIGLFLLMLITWLFSWGGLFKFCFTLLMLWVFVTSLGVAKSNIKNHFDRALYKIRS